MKTTKTMILTVLIAVSSLLTSCSKDDDNAPSIVGTWLETSSSTEIIKNGVSQGVEEGTVDANNYQKLTFNADGTFSSIYVEDGENDEESGTYTIDGNSISVIYEGETEADPDESFVLSGNQFVYGYEEGDTIGPDTYLYKYSSTFIKQ
jgi:major membrane immunogen (membrane-anchored lipoprotein)